MSKQFLQHLSPRRLLSGCRKPYMVFGTLVLVGSFVSQQFLLNRYDSRLKEIAEATAMHSQWNLQSLQYLNLYYASQAAGADDSPVLLQKAAKTNSVGTFAFIISTSLEPLEQDQWLQRLDQSVSSVKDMDSYNRHGAFLNSMQDELFPKRFAEQRYLRGAISIAQWTYLVPYFLSALLLVVGFWRGE